jgi:protoheme IX farnesyltransferase
MERRHGGGDAVNTRGGQQLALRAIVQDRSQVYVELTKPRITAMVLLTVCVGYAIAPHAATPPMALLHVLIGAALSCSGAGALNQLIERETDSVMGRTRFRPLPSHRVSPWQALAIGVTLALGGVAYLLAATNGLTAGVDAATLIGYLFLYTPLKRVTPHSTLVGAIPGALPPVMGWTAATNQIGAGAAILFAILFLWQIPHFLAIGRMYREDYARGGFPMLVVVDGSQEIAGHQMVVYALVLIPVSLLLAPLGLAGGVYFTSALVAGLAYVAAALRAARDPGVRAARALLIASVLHLPLLLGSLLLERIIA